MYTSVRVCVYVCTGIQRGSGGWGVREEDFKRNTQKAPKHIEETQKS